MYNAKLGAEWPDPPDHRCIIAVIVALILGRDPNCRAFPKGGPSRRLQLRLSEGVAAHSSTVSFSTNLGGA
jgi:hypothetical protein